MDLADHGAPAGDEDDLVRAVHVRFALRARHAEFRVVQPQVAGGAVRIGPHRVHGVAWRIDAPVQAILADDVHVAARFCRHVGQRFGLVVVDERRATGARLDGGAALVLDDDHRGIAQRLAHAFIRNAHDIHAGHALEEFRRQVCGRP